VIILTNGIYDWLPMTVCSVSPKITTVRVDYTSSINAMVDLADVAVGDLDGLPSFFAMDKLVSMAIGSQSLSHNIVGGHLSAIKAESKWETDHILEAVVSLSGISSTITNDIAGGIYQRRYRV
jgi:hypothetical protein